MKYKNRFGTINLLGKKKKFENKTIGLSMSGGADSTMLCILLAKTIQKRNMRTTIQPFNGYDMWAPLDSAGLPAIIKIVQEMFPTVDIKWPVSTVFNTDGDHTFDKNTYIRPFVKNMLTKKYIDYFIPGISLGPPLEAQQTFDVRDNDIYKIQRIPGYRLYNEVEQVDGKFAPYKHVDKRFIIQCYKDMDLKSLLDMTQSCTDPAGNCGHCWWCQERAWAIKEVFGE